MVAFARESEIAFGPYLLEMANARLLRENCPVALTPKALAVLHYLAMRPGRLVTKEELLSNVWSDVLVSDASIKVCIREIRKALDDSAKSPVYIETVHRRGYRFIATPEAGAVPAPRFAPATQTTLVTAQSSAGREAGVRMFREAFDLAASGRSQCVLISVDTKGTHVLFF